VSNNDRFKALMACKARLQAEYYAVGSPQTDAGGYYARRDATVLAAFKACEKAAGRKRARKFAWQKAKEYPECMAAQDRIMAEGSRWMDRTRADMRVLDEEMDRLAPDCDLEAESTARLGTEVCLGGAMSSTYRSQTQAAKYAKERAREYGDKAEMHGVPWRMESEKGDYSVMVPLTEAGAERLRRRPGVGLVEWARLCWKRGVNPRVYCPFLPHGFEERHGLDYFGGRKEAQACHKT
jgi:hypothetical protein